MISRILIPVADIYFLQEIEEFVKALQGQETDLRLRVLHVVDKVGTLTTLNRKCTCANGNELLETIKKQLKERFPYDHIESKLLEGDTSKAILEEADAWMADLILLGPHNKKGFADAILGSVASTVLSKPPCDVVILRLRESIANSEALSERTIAL